MLIVNTTIRTSEADAESFMGISGEIEHAENMSKKAKNYNIYLYYINNG